MGRVGRILWHCWFGWFTVEWGWWHGEIFMWSTYQYSSSLLQWHCGNRTITADVVQCYWFDKRPLRWRHNGRDGVSNHQSHDCLRIRLFRRRSKETSKPRVTGFVRGIRRWPVNSPHEESVTAKCFHLMTSSCSSLVLSPVDHLQNRILKSYHSCHFNSFLPSAVCMRRWTRPALAPSYFLNQSWVIVNWTLMLILPHSGANCPCPGVGVTKPILSVPLFSEFFSIFETHVRYWISCLYWTGIAAAQLWRYLSNMNVIQRI